MTNQDKIILWRNVAVLSGIFCLAVAALLLLNYWQISNHDPIESKVLETLVNKLRQEPNNAELITEIRNFDLLARKAYFNSQWQIKTGTYLLLAGAIVLAVALTLYFSIKSKIDEPEKNQENEITGRILAQKWLLAVGAALFISALIASFFSVNYLEKYQLEAVVTKPAVIPVNEEIEVIEVGKPKENTVSFSEIDPAQTTPETEPPVEASDSKPVQLSAQTEKSVVDNSSGTITVEQLRNNHNSFRGPLGQGIAYHKNIPDSWNGVSGSNIVWKVPVPKGGFNSPVIWGDKVFVAGANNESREVYCYNRNDGKLLWTGKADKIPGSPPTPPRVTEDTGLAAPTLTTDGQRVYAIFATGDVVAFDFSGNRIWAKNLGVPDNHYGHSSSLITWDNKLLVQYDTNKGSKLLAFDTASGDLVWETIRNAKVSWASPVLAQTDGKFQLVLTADPIVAGYDVQSGKELWNVKCMMGEVGPSVAYYDGVVYAANEYAKMVAIDIKTREILWENDMYLPEAASPLAHEGLLIIATSYGVLVCYDAKTGEQYWEHDVGKTLYSSPVYSDGKLFMMDNDGVTRVYKFGKEMKLIAENQLGEPAGTTPAFADGRIYIRGEENLYCIGK